MVKNYLWFTILSPNIYYKYVMKLTTLYVRTGINYGNVFKKHWVYGGGGVKYYNLRGMYKVDW